MKNLRVVITINELKELKKRALKKDSKAIELLKLVYYLNFEILEVED